MSDEQPARVGAVIGRALALVQAVVVTGLVVVVYVTQPYGSRPWFYLGLQPVIVLAAWYGAWRWMRRRWAWVLVCQAVVLAGPWGYWYALELFPLALMGLAGWEARKDRIAARRRPKPA